MNYEGQICRAPMERGSYMLPVAVGCSYNRCRFCNLFRHLKHRLLPFEQIEAEIQRVKSFGGNPSRIFLGDGNAFDMPYERLTAILEMVRAHFPEVKEINMDATVTGISRRTDEELSYLYDMGVRHLYLGIESGLEDVLRFMQKDHTKEEARVQIARLHKSGLIYDAHIMTGIAGHGRGEENARALAAFINETRPNHICNFSLFLHVEVPLTKEIMEGSFTPASEYENLREAKLLLELIEADEEHPIVFEGFHDFLNLRVHGTLPKDKDRMLLKLNRTLEACENDPKTHELFSWVEGDCPTLKRCDTDSDMWDMHRKSDWED